MESLPIFPLGTVLLPGMPISLRVFEERFVRLLRDVLASGSHEFGVVLIERGQEVGGGDARFGLGTVARLADVHREQAWLNVVARGTDRFSVERWLPEDPYPRAEVRRLAPPQWSDADVLLLGEAEVSVRRALALASEHTDTRWDPDVRLPGERLERAWQLAGIAPLGPLDQLDLLRSDTAAELLTRLLAHVGEAEATWT